MSLGRKIKEFLGFDPGDEVFEYEDEQELDEMESPGPRRSAAPVVPITAAPRRSGGSNVLRVVVVQPRDFEEVQTIVDQMKQGKPVILNLEGLEQALAQKIINFLNGATYALNGDTERISEVIFFFAPPGVDVSMMGRGVTGTTISGGSVDVPPEVLARLALPARTDETRREDLLRQATGRSLYHRAHRRGMVAK